MTLASLLNKLMHDAFIEATERRSTRAHELYQAFSVVWQKLPPDILWAKIDEIMEDKDDAE